MTTTTTRYALNKIVEASDNVDVVNDFNVNWDAIDLKLGTQVCTSSTRPSAPVQGQTIYETDTFYTRVYSGSAWRTVGNATATSSGLPANPLQGDIVYVTDVGALAYYSGGAWHYASVFLGTAASVPTGSAVQTGTMIFATDTASIMVDVGSNTWRHKSIIVCTSTTRPTLNLGNGALILETDTGQVFVYSSNNWIPVGSTLMATPLATSSNGTPTSTTVETFDAVLGYLQASLISGRRYTVECNGLVGNGNTAADNYQIQIRDSQSSSNPTSASTLISQTQWYCNVAGTPGRTGIALGQSFLCTVTGTHTFGVSAVRISGSGIFTPVGQRELLITDMGAAF